MTERAAARRLHTTYAGLAAVALPLEGPVLAQDRDFRLLAEVSDLRLARRVG